MDSSEWRDEKKTGQAISSVLFQSYQLCLLFCGQKARAKMERELALFLTNQYLAGFLKSKVGNTFYFCLQDKMRLTWKTYYWKRQKKKQKRVQCKKKKARFDIFWLSTYLSTKSKNTRGKIDFACSDIFQQNIAVAKKFTWQNISMSVTLAFFRQVIHTQLQIDYHKMKNLCTFTTMLLNYLFTCSGHVFLKQNYQMANSTIF